MSDDVLKIGIVGLRRGRALAVNLFNMEGVEIKAICDLNDERLDSCTDWLKNEKKIENFKCYKSYEEMLKSDIDAVIIATDAGLHVKMSIQALKAGKHVYSEVPAINTVEEAAELYKTVKSTGKKYMMGENCCFYPFILTWKKIIEMGLLGTPWYAEGEYLHNVVYLMKDKDGKPSWRSTYDSIKYLTHDLGPLLYIMDDRCVSVSGFAPEINSIPEYSTGTPDEVAIFKTKKGALIKIFVSFGIQREPARHNYCLYGSKGTVETTRHGDYKVNAYFKDIPNTTDMISIPVGISYPDISSDIGHGGADFYSVEGFIKSIKNDTEPPVDVVKAIRMSIPGIYAEISKEKGSIPVKIPDVEDLV